MKISVNEMYDTIIEKEEYIKNGLDTIGIIYDDIPALETIIHLYASKEVYGNLIDEYRNDKDNLDLVLSLYHSFEAQLEGYIEGVKEYANNDEFNDRVDNLIETLDDLDNIRLEIKSMGNEEGDYESI